MSRVTEKQSGKHANMLKRIHTHTHTHTHRERERERESETRHLVAT